MGGAGGYRKGKSAREKREVWIRRGVTGGKGDHCPDKAPANDKGQKTRDNNQRKKAITV